MTKPMNKTFHKILIIGNGGSGKSTLAKQLQAILDMPVLHLDRIYWKNSFDKNHSAEFEHALKQFMQKEKWIIEGTPMKGIEKSLQDADTIIFIDMNTIQCVYRVFKRRLSYFIRSLFHQPIESFGCPAIEISYKALSWIWRFSDKQRPIILDHLKNAPANAIFWIKNQTDKVNMLRKFS